MDFYGHHAKNLPKEYRYGVNFASALNIWDVLFKVYYLPDGKKPKLGVFDNDEVPDSFLGQLIYPLKYLWNKKRATNRFDKPFKKKVRKNKK